MYQSIGNVALIKIEIQTWVWKFMYLEIWSTFVFSNPGVNRNHQSLQVQNFKATKATDMKFFVEVHDPEIFPKQRVLIIYPYSEIHDGGVNVCLNECFKKLKNWRFSDILRHFLTWNRLISLFISPMKNFELILIKLYQRQFQYLL